MGVSVFAGTVGMVAAGAAYQALGFKLAQYGKSELEEKSIPEPVAGVLFVSALALPLITGIAASTTSGSISKAFKWATATSALGTAMAILKMSQEESDVDEWRRFQSAW